VWCGKRESGGEEERRRGGEEERRRGREEERKRRPVRRTGVPRRGGEKTLLWRAGPPG